MSYRGWFQFGTVELANSARAAAYLDRCNRTSTVEVFQNDSWPDQHIYLSQEPYSDPADDGAPWWQADVPASVDFYGVWPLAVDGLDSTPIDRTVNESAGVGAAFGVPHPESRKLKFEALLLAGTPEGAEYGLGWLNAALRGDLCAEPDEPRMLRYLDVTPPLEWDDTDAEVRAKAYAHERWLYDVALTSSVEITQRFGQYLPERRQSTCFKVTFELTAGNPYIWRAPTSLVDPILLSAGTPLTVTFEKQVAGECPTACPPGDAPLYDPNLPAPVALPRPLTPASAVGCAPIESKRTRVTLPSSSFHSWESQVPTVVIQTGPQAERYVRIQWSRGVDITDLGCQSIGEVMIGYIPANATFTLDGVTGQARCTNASGVEVDATSVVSGRLGGPWRPPVMRCGDAHTLVIDTANTVHANVRAVVTSQVRAA